MLMGSIARTNSPAPKGRPPLRKCPDDFDVIFVEQGRLGCEAWYRARRDTITRWMVEKGKDRLIKARAAYVAHQRANGQWLTRSSKMVETRIVSRAPARTQPTRDRRKVSPTVARHAAQWLRVIRNGGFIVSMAQNGDWRVGTKLLSAAQLLDLAVSKGFDPDVRELPPEPTDARVIAVRSGSSEQRNQWRDDWIARWRRENGNSDFNVGSQWQEGDVDHEDLDQNLQPLTGRRVKDSE